MSMNTAELARCIASESEDPVKRIPRFEEMVGVLGVEPRTSSLSGTRSNQLSYTPISVLVEPKGLEPSTSCLQSRHSSQLS